jgi:hypothetical protein
VVPVEREECRESHPSRAELFRRVAKEPTRVGPDHGHLQLGGDDFSRQSDRVKWISPHGVKAYLQDLELQHSRDALLHADPVRIVIAEPVHQPPRTDLEERVLRASPVGSCQQLVSKGGSLTNETRLDVSGHSGLVRAWPTHLALDPQRYFARGQSASSPDLARSKPRGWRSLLCRISIPIGALSTRYLDGVWNLDQGVPIMDPCQVLRAQYAGFNDLGS